MSTVARPERADAVTRGDGYAAIGDYGAIGDGRATALVARDGAIDWLCLPAHDSGSVFAALLDPDDGGAFQLAPAEPGFGAKQRYLPSTNVLETTFETSTGTVVVTDAVTADAGRLLPWWELVRRVECVAGSVPMRWSVEPRFGYGSLEASLSRLDEHVTIAESDAGALAVLAWDAGDPVAGRRAVSAERRFAAGERATLAMVHSIDSPIALPSRGELEDRLDRTINAWREWLDAHDYEGPWQHEVERSLLAMRLLTTPSGAIAAAATTSLPERIGGNRNYDYRHAWPRDSSLALAALLQTGLREPAHTSLAWLLKALESTHPRVQPIYRLESGPLVHQFELPFAGYRGSRPVRDGNDAAGQLQLGAYGDLLHTAWLYVRQGNRLDAGTAQRLAENADVVCELWQNEDSGIWELPDQRHYTSSKMGAWLALTYALDLAGDGRLRGAENEDRWRQERKSIAAFVEDRCWSEDRRSYVQAPDSDALDVSTVLMLAKGYDAAAGEGRARATLEAIRSELQEDHAVYRYSGMREHEGAFVACSFWTADALARHGAVDDASELFEAALRMTSHVGLLSEEFDPSTGELLGNYPQALSHLALINCAATIRSRS
jgi:GH15 family glucan-1,4-alpha-glucosidase